MKMRTIIQLGTGRDSIYEHEFGPLGFQRDIQKFNFNVHLMIAHGIVKEIKTI